MARFDGVDPQAAACPTCGRRKGLPCAKKATAKDVREGGINVRFAVGDWIGASKRSHPARVTAAQQAKIKGGVA